MSVADGKPERRAAALLLCLALAGCATREPEPSPQARQVIAQAAVAERDGDWTLALARLEEARKLDPGSSLAALEAGRLLERMGFFAEAVSAYEEASQRAPKSPRAELKLASLYRRHERAALVERAIAAARAKTPRDPDVLLAHARARLAANDLWEAASALGEVLRQRPRDAEALALSGTLERRRQAYGVAESQLRLAIELDPRNIDARIELAGVYKDYDRTADAIRTLEEARALSPRAAIRYELARLYVKAHRPELAAALTQEHLNRQVAEAEPLGLIESLWTHPKVGELRERLALTLVRAGRPEDAEGILRGWLRVAPDNPAPRRALEMLKGGNPP